MTPGRPHAGFSLVEVIVAIGIASFCILAILGLFTVGFQTGLRARDFTVVAGASTRLMSELRARTNLSAQTNWFFDNDGLVVTNSSGALYKCAVTTNTIPETDFPGVGTNLIQVRMQFTWPASLTNPANTNTVYATLP